MARAATSRKVADVTFEKYLALRRRNPVEFNRTYQNPYADDLAKALDAHLKTIRYWLTGTINTEKMREAMEFFAVVFRGEYAAKEGRMLYRGQYTAAMDGTPRSYSYEKWIADAFACESGAGPFAKLFSKYETAFLIKRKVCHGCADKSAFALSLDLVKVLSDYGTGKHKFAVESEVVILNTPPKGKTASIFQIECDREAA